MTKLVASLAVFTLAGSAFAAVGDVWGYTVQSRDFNDFPNSILTVNGLPAPFVDPAAGAVGGVGTSVNFIEQFGVGAVGNFANRHAAWLSANPGVNRYNFQRNDSFYFQTNIRINVPNGSSPKEGGLQFFHQRNVIDPGPTAVTFTDEGFFNVRSSDGEVAIFGGALPFHSFGNVYVVGTTATIGFAYYAPGVAGPNGAVEYFYNGVGSGIKFMNNGGDRVLAGDVSSPTYGFGGISNFANLGLRAQNTRNPFIADSSDILYNGQFLIPTPGAGAVLVLGGLIAGRRRRA
jgi:hypothetical protein